MYCSPNSSTMVCVPLYTNGISRATPLFFVASTYSNPGRFSAGPCGVAIKFRSTAAPVWYFASSIRPYIAALNSPPANDRVNVFVFAIYRIPKGLQFALAFALPLSLPLPLPFWLSSPQGICFCSCSCLCSCLCSCSCPYHPSTHHNPVILSGAQRSRRTCQTANITPTARTVQPQLPPLPLPTNNLSSRPQRTPPNPCHLDRSAERAVERSQHWLLHLPLRQLSPTAPPSTEPLSASHPAAD